MPATAKYISEESAAAAGVLDLKLLNDTETRDILKISLVEGAPVSQLLVRTAPWCVSLLFRPRSLVGLLLHEKYRHLSVGIMTSLSVFPRPG